MPLGVNQHAWYGAQICHLQKKMSKHFSDNWNWNSCLNWYLRPEYNMSSRAPWRHGEDVSCWFNLLIYVLLARYGKLFFENTTSFWDFMRPLHSAQNTQRHKVPPALPLPPLRHHSHLWAPGHGSTWETHAQNPAPVKVYSLSHDVYIWLYMSINSAIHLRWCRNFLYLNCKTAKPSGSSTHIAHHHLLLASANLQSLFLCYITIDIWLWYMLYIYTYHIST